MRIRSMVAVLVMGLGASATVTARPQPEAVMTISGIAGQFAVRADRTDWTQIKGMPDPRDSQGSGIDILTGSRAGSLLTSQGTPPGADRGSSVAIRSSGGVRPAPTIAALRVARSR